MRFLLDGQWVERPSFWLEEGRISLLDQRRLPGSTVVIGASTIDEQADAIRTLAVRGAPAIGVFGAMSLALAIERGEDPDISFDTLIRTRPTAVDLKNCMERVLEECHRNGKDELVKMVQTMADDIIYSCRRIGENGCELVGDSSRVMTHCNAGALATMDWGTALSPIRMAFRRGRNPFVWVSETRPLLQGSRLTSWELKNEGIDHRLIVDGASAHIMSKGKVDLVIVGADRVARNGDIANKIGTLDKALLAREFGIPFYVAFPRSTIDLQCKSAMGIPIEERSQEEVLNCSGSRISPEDVTAFNPAFDITPSQLITGFITEDGILSPGMFVNENKN